MKTAAALALAAVLAPASAAAVYPVEIEEQMNGLGITVAASAGTPLVLTFRSAEKAAATCRAEVANAFDTPFTRTVTVKPGKSATASFKLRSAPNRVRVKVACEPAAVRSDRKP
jgi:hypothetical protein